MACGLYKYRKEIATHYIGRTGNEYSKEEYANWGSGKAERGKKDLPLDEYPYEIKYKTEPFFVCCKLCLCEGK